MGNDAMIVFNQAPYRCLGCVIWADKHCSQLCFTGTSRQRTRDCKITIPSYCCRPMLLIGCMRGIFAAPNNKLLRYPILKYFMYHPASAISRNDGLKVQWFYRLYQLNKIKWIHIYSVLKIFIIFENRKNLTNCNNGLGSCCDTDSVIING